MRSSRAVVSDFNSRRPTLLPRLVDDVVEADDTVPPEFFPSGGAFGAVPPHGLVPASAATYLPLRESERHFGRFTLLRRLAAGGMGEVFLARDGGPTFASDSARLVVLKRVLTQLKHEAKHVRMFTDEARLHACLVHPNIVAVEEIGEEAGQAYIAMEHVAGPSLRNVIDSCRHTETDIHPGHVLDLLLQASSGMAYAHTRCDARGVPLLLIHRDLNPHNILVTFDGVVKIIDFGIAKSTAGTNRTDIGIIKGKVQYMSPEQSLAQVLDARSDIFSFGICMYELLTLENPFKKAGLVPTLQAVQNDMPPLLSHRRSDARALIPIVDKCLAKRREDRYASMDDVHQALLQVQQQGLLPTTVTPLRSWLRDRFAEATDVPLGWLGSASTMEPSLSVDVSVLP